MAIDLSILNPFGIPATDAQRRSGRLMEFDLTQSRFFDLMRQQFQQRSEREALGQRTTGARALELDAARKGLSFSGIEQAQLGTLQGTIGVATANARNEFAGQLAAVAQQQRDAFVRGEFEFFNQLELLDKQFDLTKDLERFRTDLQKELNSGWNQFFNVLGTFVGAAIGAKFA